MTGRRRTRDLRRVLIGGVILLAMPAAASADRGSIPLRPGVKLYEPNQRAIIAWDGKREILLLSTDLRASKPTKILQVLPLPSRPTVKKGSLYSFRVATSIINAHRVRRARNGRHRRSMGARRARPKPAGRVVFAKKIGSHHISVTEVLNGPGFVAWVQKYLKKRGYKNARIPAKLKSVVLEYIRDGFKWFVFDIVAVGRRRATLDAIQYSFATKRLYYPLRITRTESGWTRVKLLLITPYLIGRKNFVGLRYARVKVPHKPVPISRYQLKRISREMWKLMKRYSGYKLRVWQISGFLNRFRRDLLCTAGPMRVRRRSRR